MAPHVFWTTAFTELPVYPFYFLISIILHWFLFRKYILSVLDPLFMVVLGFTFSFSTLLFVFSVSDMSCNSLLSIISMQLAGYVGFLILAPRVTKIKHMFLCSNHLDTTISLNFRYSVLIVGFSCFVISTLLQYLLVGIPLFKTSRLGSFDGSGGLGVILRFQEICFVISAIFIARLILSPKVTSIYLRFVRSICVILLLILLLLSGSKGAALVFVQIAYVLYACNYFNKNQSLPRVLTFRSSIIGCLLLLSSFVALYMHPYGEIFDQISGSKPIIILLSFFYRLINFGDIYIYYFVNSAFDSIQHTDGLSSLFAGLLKTFRIQDPATIPIPLGYELAKQAIPGLDIIAGPNSHAAVFGFHYFGVACGLLFTLVMGCIMGFARLAFISAISGLIFKVTKFKFLSSVALFIFGLMGLTILFDPPYFISNLASFIIVIPIIITCTLVLWFGQSPKVIALQ